MQSLAIVAALAADLLWGEPHVKWHPVAVVGRAIGLVGGVLRRGPEARILNKLTGTAMVAFFASGSYISTGAIILWLSSRSFWAGVAAQAALMWISVSVGELTNVARRVDGLVSEGRLNEARSLLKSLVGRYTARLTPTEIRVAAIESVGENLVDAGTAPVFWALLGGAPLAFSYRVINTMDSMFGYKTPENIDFGWAAARLDDLVSWLPARLTVFIIWLAGIAGGRRKTEVVRTAFSHGRRHASPNSGLAIAAFAAALSVRLGGAREYGGTSVVFGHFGVDRRRVGSGTVREARILAHKAIAIAGIGLAVATMYLRG